MTVFTDYVIPISPLISSLRVPSIILPFATALRKRICVVSVIVVCSSVNVQHSGAHKRTILARFIFDSFQAMCSLRFRRTFQQFHVTIFIVSPTLQPK